MTVRTRAPKAGNPEARRQRRVVFDLCTAWPLAESASNEAAATATVGLPGCWASHGQAKPSAATLKPVRSRTN